MTTRALMFMGTGSDVGKSLIVAGLCRAFASRGLRVAPFKPQNMSNNAAVTADGGEIGRAQALQALASRLEPLTAMNPVLLKPEHDTGAQVVVRGKRVASMPAREYFATRQKFMPDVLTAFHELAEGRDLVLVEGAGSASEVNLRHNDLANFGFARAAAVPVIIIGDIERGGVIAAIAGTLAVIAPEDAALVRGTMINKFRGDPGLFSDGMRFLEMHTGRPCFGPVPIFGDAVKLPAEDALALDRTSAAGGGKLRIAVPRLPRISNFDDLDPLRAEPDVALTIVALGEAIPRDTDLIILPGSKSTRADLDALRNQGWHIDIAAHVRAGGHVLGLCGGYQMLGHAIADPDGIEGTPGTSEGLGLLDVETVLTDKKELRVEQAVHEASGVSLSGYHIHMGSTSGSDCTRPFARVGGTAEGAVSEDGRIIGTYLHGIFAGDEFRRSFLTSLGAAPETGLMFTRSVDRTLDALAVHLESAIDLDALLALAAPIDLAART